MKKNYGLGKTYEPKAEAIRDNITRAHSGMLLNEEKLTTHLIRGIEMWHGLLSYPEASEAEKEDFARRLDGFKELLGRLAFEAVLAGNTKFFLDMAQSVERENDSSNRPYDRNRFGALTTVLRLRYLLKREPTKAAVKQTAKHEFSVSFDDKGWQRFFAEMGLSNLPTARPGRPKIATKKPGHI